MKRIAIMVLSLVLMLILWISIYTHKKENIYELLAPYQVAIDKLNLELGSALYIPDKNKEKVYNNIKDMSPDEVEAMLRAQYKACVNGESINTQMITDDYIRDSVMEKD